MGQFGSNGFPRHLPTSVDQKKLKLIGNRHPQILINLADLKVQYSKPSLYPYICVTYLPIVGTAHCSLIKLYIQCLGVLYFWDVWDVLGVRH
jgi:hypothetical protein